MRPRAITHGGRRALRWPSTTSALTQQQMQQNYAAGVGASYYLLFDVSALTGTSQSYIMFTASQYDNYSYLFYRPTFINLNSAFTPSNIPISGIRIGINGTEVPVDQAYIPLNVTINSSADYSTTTGSCCRRSAP